MTSGQTHCSWGEAQGDRGPSFSMRRAGGLHGVAWHAGSPSGGEDAAGRSLNMSGVHHVVLERGRSTQESAILGWLGSDVQQIAGLFGLTSLGMQWVMWTKGDATWDGHQAHGCEGSCSEAAYVEGLF